MLMDLSDIRMRVNAAILLGDMQDYVRDVSYLLDLIELLQKEIARLLDSEPRKPRYN